MQSGSFYYYAARIIHAWFLAVLGLALILGSLMLVAPRYASAAWLTFPPLLVLAYLYGAPWLWRRFPWVIKR